ncbi:MAG: preprotein translocase subunit SecG [Candidatus Omnitrophota bacterium]
MFALLIVVHVIVSVLLIVVVLMQSGRGGGLTEGLAAGAESLFGAKTNTFMVRLTAFLAVGFLVTTLSLAFLSTQRNKSLMERKGVAANPEAKDLVPTPTTKTAE